MFCSKCGAQIPDDSKVCPKCGARLGVQNDATSQAAANAAAAPVAPVAPNPVLEAVKKFQALVFVGIGCEAVFILLMFFVERFDWWLMLPLGIGGGFCFWRSLKKAQGLERKVCLVGLALACALLLFRDIELSYRLESFASGLRGMMNFGG